MQIDSVARERSGGSTQLQKEELQKESPLPLRTRVALLTGCQDRHYAFGLATALAAAGISVDVIGSDEIASTELNRANVRFLNFLRGFSTDLSFPRKLKKVVGYYAKLIEYVARPEAKVLHILWNFKAEHFDRTVLMLYYRLFGKRVFLTAHNVNKARRDANDSWLNRTTLKIQYKLCDHIFVHTEKMKRELCQEFGVADAAVTVIQYPINNAFPDTDLTPEEAKRRLGVRADERAILFFGRIVPYKGIEYLLDAFDLLLKHKFASYRMILAGEPKKGAYEYFRSIEASVNQRFEPGKVVLRAEYIPDHDIEIYLKGTDVLVLPYKDIFQSGILIMAYSFGLPVVATNVGSFAEDVIEGKTGFLCEPGDPAALAAAIDRYFASELYRDLALRRPELKNRTHSNHSWRAVVGLTCGAYRQSLARDAAQA